MERRQFLGFGGASVLAGVLGSCAGPVEELRYRLTVEVDTPEGLKTGSSVIEVRGQRNHDWVNPEGRGTRSSFKGEAVAVDLPGGKTLFALLVGVEGGGSDAMNYPWLAFQDRLKQSEDYLDDLRLMRRWRGEIAPMPLTRSLQKRGVGLGIQNPVACNPKLVTFSDLADPKTVIEVTPQTIGAVFGSGVNLKRITIEITDDSITKRLSKRLPWLNDYFNKTFAGNRFAISRSLPDSLSAGAFTTERL